MGATEGGVTGSHNFPLSDSKRRKCAETSMICGAHQSLTRIREAGESSVSVLTWARPASTPRLLDLMVMRCSTWASTWSPGRRSEVGARLGPAGPTDGPGPRDEHTCARSSRVLTRVVLQLQGCDVRMDHLMASTVPGPPSCPATIRSNGASSNPPSSSSAFGGTCGMP